MSMNDQISHPRNAYADRDRIYTSLAVILISLYPMPFFFDAIRLTGVCQDPSGP